MVLALRWYGADLVTGEIIEELPDLVPSGSFGRVINQYTSAQFSLPLTNPGNYGAPPDDWVAATEPGRTMIVVTLQEQPIWAGRVLPREGGTESTLSVACATLESYLEARYVGSHTYVNTDAGVIAADLIDDGNLVEGLDLTPDVPALGTLVDLREYLDTDDKTVYRTLSELADADLIEWTIDLEWLDDDHTAFAKVIRVRSRIGVPAPASGPGAVFDVQAASVFESPADADTRYTYRESYATGDGANHIVAVGDGQGDERPQSAPARAEDLIAAGWPRYEFRFKPSASISDLTTLDEHAAARLARMREGSRAITLTARADVYPMLGQHWGLGDDIGYDLVSPRHPDGFSGVARAIGWDLDATKDTVSPIVLLPGQDEEGEG